MYILFEDSGKYLTGKQLSATDSSCQVELASGKRVKVKKTHLLLEFQQPDAEQMALQAAELAKEIDLDLVWEFAPSEEFNFVDLALEYFGDQATTLQKAAMAYCLFAAPHYFRRSGRGRFKKANAEVLAQALAAIAKKQQITAMIEQWTAQLLAGTCPVEIKQQLYKILFKPDKNSPEYKAVAAAAQQSKKSVLDLMRDIGMMTSAFEFHWQRFVFENYAAGWQFPQNLTLNEFEQALEQSSVKAYSIDDANTTEIDDALSLQGLGTDEWVLGIHIAIPSLGLPLGSDWDKVAAKRLSTMYMPGYKITMLPDQVVERFSLDEGGYRPALSLYISFNAQTLEIKSSQTKVEQVWIERNVRLHELAAIDNEAWFNNPVDDESLAISQQQLLAFYQIALASKERRLQQRGKPEHNNRQDFNFELDNQPGELPSGEEKVSLSTRARGAPIDLIVAESMILANQTWGKLLAEHSVPGIYRYQISLQPGIRVRMGTRALPHAGMGLDCYAWCTSPLRRYVDLINQQQLLACVMHGKTAALAAPFKAKDASLFSIISAFDATYSAYGAFQKQIEKYWTLRYIEQNDLYEQDCEVLTEGENGSYIVRSTQLPLVFSVTGVPSLNKPVRGCRLKVRIEQIDLLELTAPAHYLALIEQSDAAVTDEDFTEDLLLDAGKLTLAIDECIQQEEQEPAAVS